MLDLEGRTALPGFQDAHCHPAESGVESLRCTLDDAHTREACLEEIARYAAAHPELEWVVGSGWSIDSFEHGTPSRADLDAIVPDRPAFFDNRDGHGAWVNTRALALAGIGARHARPAGRAHRARGVRRAAGDAPRRRDEPRPRPDAAGDRRTNGRPGSCARRPPTTRSGSPPGRTRGSTGPWPSPPTAPSPSAAS